jgi:predicted negative regulator of RcsB-dependent stress response
MNKNNSISSVFLILIVVVINLFGALYYYNHVTGQIDQARILYEKVYGNDGNFNSVFWLCQKIFMGGH